MSRFVQRSVERLELGGGDWVDLLARLSYGDRAGIQEKLIGATVPVNGGAPAVPGSELHLVAANLELLRVAIMAWGGPGFCARLEHPHEGDCQPVPITAESIAQLDETGERILLELQRRMVPPATPDFTKPPSPRSSTAGRAVRRRRGSKNSG